VLLVTAIGADLPGINPAPRLEMTMKAVKPFSYVARSMKSEEKVDVRLDE
jgi:hypothetical protein